MTVTIDDQRSPLRGREVECATLDELVADARGTGPCARAARRGGHREDRALGPCRPPRIRLSRASGIGCRVRDGAGLRRTPSGVHTDGRASRSLAGTPGIRARNRLRAPCGRATGSLPGRVGGAEPHRRRRGERATALSDRRRAMARPGVRASVGVRRTPAPGRARRVGVRGTRAERTVRALPASRARDRRTDRRSRPRAARLGPRRVGRRSSPRPHRRRDPRQPPRLARTSSRHDPSRVGRGVRLPDTMPLVGRIEQGFLRQLQSLPIGTRTLLLLAAIEPVGDSMLLWRAAARLDLGPEDAVPAEQSGLVTIGERVRFRHPLVRSAVCRDASEATLRKLHDALADATDPTNDPDRRAWHRGRAASQPDEETAEELERSAGRAQSRGGAAAAASFLQRATELTPDAERRGRRALVAAQAKFDAGAPDAGLELLEIAQRCPLDATHGALLERLRAQFSVGSGLEVRSATDILVNTARRLEPVDVELARMAHLTALGVTMMAGHLAADGSVVLATEAARAAPPATAPRPTDLVLDGLTDLMHAGAATGIPSLTRALRAFASPETDDEECLQWSWLVPGITPEVWDEELWDQVTAAPSTSHATGARSSSCRSRSSTEQTFGSMRDSSSSPRPSSRRPESSTARPGNRSPIHCSSLLPGAVRKPRRLR